MNFLAILRSIEDVIYEIALWIVFTPKTFFKVLFQPSWPYSYLVAEWEKEATAKYDRYMSPILFWVFVCVIPYIYALDFVFSIISSAGTSEGLNLLKLLASLPFEYRFLFVATFLISGPLGFSMAILWTRKLAITRTILQRFFYTQCYCFGIAYLFLLPFVVLFLLTPETPVGGFLAARHPYAFATYIVSTNLFFWWLVFAEMRILARELGRGWLKTMAFFFAFLLVAFALMLALEAVLVIVLMAGRRYLAGLDS